MNNYSVFSAIFPLLVSFTSFNTHLFSSDCIYVLFCLVLTALLISAGANVQADDKTNWKAKKKKKKVNNVRISGGEKLHLFIFCSVWKFRRLKVKYVSMHIKKPMKDVKLYWNTIERNSNMSNKVVASFQSLEIWDQTVSWSVLKVFFIWLIWWYIYFLFYLRRQNFPPLLFCCCCCPQHTTMALMINICSVLFQCWTWLH